MQLVYLDEAGISNPAQETHLVVAGVIVNPDRKWRQLETYFRDLFNSSFPERADDLETFIFHAKDIWHGSGPFDRKNWSRKNRMKILMQLAQVPRLFELPIVVGAYDRNEAQIGIQAKSPKVDARGSLFHSHECVRGGRPRSRVLDDEKCA